MKLLVALSWASLAVAGALLVFLGAVSPGIDTPFFWFDLVYVIPPAAIGLLLRSSRRELRTIAGLLALTIGAFCALSSVIGVANGMSDDLRILWPMLAAAGLYLVIFWAAVLRPRERRAPSTA